MDQGLDGMTTRSSAAVPVAESPSYDGNKPPQEIEKDIAHTRVRLGAIEALEHELAPRRVLKTAWSRCGALSNRAPARSEIRSGDMRSHWR
jgi:hypothetical protein